MAGQIKGALSGRTAEGWGGREGICEQEMQMPTDVMDHKTQKACALDKIR